LFDQMFLHGIAIHTSTCQLMRHRLLVEAERDDDGLQWTAVSYQGDHEGDDLYKRTSPQSSWKETP
jgi:hypothetical protein